jgi:predicted nucleotidyltransferase
MNKPSGIDAVVQQKITSILKALFPNARVILFGSRALGTHRQNSDIDIAIDAGIKLDRSAIGEARDMLNASNMPYHFDIVDIQSVPDEMRKIILKEGIIWND